MLTETDIAAIGFEPWSSGIEFQPISKNLYFCCIVWIP